MQVRRGNYYTLANTKFVTVGDEVIMVKKPKANKVVKPQTYCFLDGVKFCHLGSFTANHGKTKYDAKEILIGMYPNQAVTFELV